MVVVDTVVAHMVVAHRVAVGCHTVVDRTDYMGFHPTALVSAHREWLCRTWGPLHLVQELRHLDLDQVGCWWAEDFRLCAVLEENDNKN